MLRRYFGFSIMSCILIFTAWVSLSFKAEPNPKSCTSFMAAYGDKVLFGDSEDANLGHPLGSDPEDSMVFYYPAAEGIYGRMHLGWLWQGKYTSFQAGMNDQGLAYSVTAVPDTPMNPHPERPFSFAEDDFFNSLLKEASNVEEAIAHTLQFDFESWWGQFVFADASGDAAVIGPGPDGELAVTRKDPGDGFLVASTFNLVDPEQYEGKDSFKRYDDAVALLSEIREADDLTIPLFRSALDAVHRERNLYCVFDLCTYSVYSSTFDLQNGVAHLYFLSEFDESAEINLAEELARGAHSARIMNLISDEARISALNRYQSIQTRGKIVLFVLPLSGLAVLAYFLARSITHRRQQKATSLSHGQE
jgi:hypothetical protein